MTRVTNAQILEMMQAMRDENAALRDEVTKLKSQPAKRELSVNRAVLTLNASKKSPNCPDHYLLVNVNGSVERIALWGAVTPGQCRVYGELDKQSALRTEEA